MKSKKLTKQEAASLIIFALILGGSALAAGWHLGYRGFNPFSRNSNGSLSLSDLDHVYHLIDSYYYQPIESKALIAGSVNDLIAGLGDRHSFYISADEYRKIKAQDNGQLFDIGILYVTRNKQGLVLEVYPGTPAEAAGIKPGDIVTSVDGVATASLPGALPITLALLGEDGESVAVTVLRKDGSTKSLAITRKRYQPPTASFKLLDGQIGYLKIYSFDTQLEADFGPVIQEIKSSGVRKLVIDLRNNPGGDIDTTAAVLDKFLGKGRLFSEQIGRSSKMIDHQASGNDELAGIKIALLVNDLTASAAEVFAAALQENHRAIVVGATTEGKATEQSYFELGDGSAVRLSIGKWFTPGGEWLNGKGITPDVAVPNATGTEDVFLNRAVEQLNKNN